MIHITSMGNIKGYIHVQCTLQVCLLHDVHFKEGGEWGREKERKSSFAYLVQYFKSLDVGILRGVEFVDDEGAGVSWEVGDLRREVTGSRDVGHCPGAGLDQLVNLVYCLFVRVSVWCTFVRDYQVQCTTTHVHTS